MRTSKCKSYMFNFCCECSLGLDPGYKCAKGIFDRSKFKVTRDISPTISGWLLVCCSKMTQNITMNKIYVAATEVQQLLSQAVKYNCTKSPTDCTVQK